MGDPKCPVCKADRNAVALTSTVQTPHFRHPPKSGCPLVHWERHGEKDFDHDPAVILEKKRRAYRFESLEGVYLLCHCLFGKGNLPIALFVELLAEADARELWRLKQMETWNLGYRLALSRPTYKDSRGGPDFCFRMGGRGRAKGEREFLKVAVPGGEVLGTYPCAFWKYRREAGNNSWLEGSRAREILRRFAADFWQTQGRAMPLTPPAPASVNSRPAAGARPVSAPSLVSAPTPWRRSR